MSGYDQKIRWTANQLKYLRENYNGTSDEKIAEIVGRTAKAVRLKRQRLGLEKEGGRGNAFAKVKVAPPVDPNSNTPYTNFKD